MTPDDKDFPSTDNLGDPLPPFETVYFQWLTTTQASVITSLTTAGVAAACASKRLRAVKLKKSSKYSGEWRIDPASAQSFVKHSKRP